MNTNHIRHSKIIEEFIKRIPDLSFKKTEASVVIAAHIDDGLTAMNWTKHDLAKKLKKKPSTITKWMSGTHNFKINTILDIQNALNIQIINIEDLNREKQKESRRQEYLNKIQSTDDLDKDIDSDFNDIDFDIANDPW